MCGIVAILRKDGGPVDQTVLRTMTDSLAHRGPDGSGLHVESSVGLGHRRLAIIDLSRGHQPLSNEDGTVWITFNGEIYNYRELKSELESKGHRFKTDSDTETIIHAYEQWGSNCLQRLRGMFAFAIWDEKRRKLFVARDRFGIKPLVYCDSPSGFFAASEIQALKSHPEFCGTIDPAAIDLYLQYQYIPAPKTIYKEVRKLPPAHYLEVHADGRVSQPQQYWDIHFEADRSLTEAEWVERLDAALDETVKAHLVSDVPFGAFLSGGVDSSTVVAYMSRSLNAPVKAFTIGSSSGSYDESAWARQAAAVTGCDHEVRTVDVDALELLPKLVRHFGEPFADSSAIATYAVSEVARQSVKMVLSGDGGDELFAGYYSYPAIIWETDPEIPWQSRVKRWIADRARAMGAWPGRLTSEECKYQRDAVIPEECRRNLWRSEFSGTIVKTRFEFERSFASRQGESLLHRLQRFDIGNYIAHDNLPKVDVASMCHGLEVRVPLLDHVFFETASQVPPELKLHAQMRDGRDCNRLRLGDDVTGKYLLKKNAERFFGRDFVHREKKGFEVPICDWFGGQQRDDLRMRLTGPESALHDFFRAESLREISDQAAADRMSAWRAWSLLVLNEWLRQSREPLRSSTDSDQRLADITDPSCTVDANQPDCLSAFP